MGPSSRGSFSVPQGPSMELSPQLAADEAGKSWISQAYGGVILFEDLTPNLGLWWCGHSLYTHGSTTDYEQYLQHQECRHSYVVQFCPASGCWLR